MKTRWIALVALVAGCADTSLAPTTLDVYSLKLHEGANVKEGIGLLVQPITVDAIAKYPGIAMRASWRERNQNQVGGMGGGTSTVPRSALVAILPIPALIVRIANHSDHALALAGAQLELKDDKGTTYKLFASANELQGRVQSDIQSSRPALADNQEAMESVQNAISKLPLLTGVKEVKAGEEWQGYVVFDFKAHGAGELDALLQNLDHFTFKIAARNDAGAPVELDAQLDRAKLQLTMSCPKGSPPAAARCKDKDPD